MIRSLLLSLHRHRIAGTVALVIYALAVTFPHQWVQQVVGDWGARITNVRVYRISAGIGIGEAILFTLLFLWIAARRSAGTARTWLIAFWFAAMAVSIGTWRILTANNVELVHYPQYFPEGMALAAMTYSPAESLAWVILCASFDEGFQYIYLMTGRAAPFDFNDVYMDLGGAALGIAFAFAVMGVTRAAREKDWYLRLLKRPGILTILAIAGVGVILWETGKLALYQEPGNQTYWFAMSRLKTMTFWYFSPVILGPHHFHELNPVEGPILILLTIALFSVFDGTIRVAGGPDARRRGAGA